MEGFEGAYLTALNSRLELEAIDPGLVGSMGGSSRGVGNGRSEGGEGGDKSTRSRYDGVVKIDSRDMSMAEKIAAKKSGFAGGEGEGGGSGEGRPRGPMAKKLQRDKEAKLIADQEEAVRMEKERIGAGVAEWHRKEEENRKKMQHSKKLIEKLEKDRKNARKKFAKDQEDQDAQHLIEDLRREALEKQTKRQLELIKKLDEDEALEKAQLLKANQLMTEKKRLRD